MANTFFLDTRRLLCPLPVIRTQEKVKKLNNGDILEVIGTDLGILHDIPAWCRINGHHVLKTHEENNEYQVIFQINA